MIDFTQFDSLIAMTMYFNNEETCRNAIIETRWGKGEQQDVVCPYCGEHHCKMSKSGRFHCATCNKNFFCKVDFLYSKKFVWLNSEFVVKCYYIVKYKQ